MRIPRCARDDQVGAGTTPAQAKLGRGTQITKGTTTAIEKRNDPTFAKYANIDWIRAKARSTR